jgi:tetratricopeptide (TPR) repeat protein
MRSNRLPFLILLLLLVVCFSLAGRLEPRFQALRQARSGDVLSVLMGDSRRIFADHFFVKADAYFHSGFYPTMFDNQESFQTPHMAEDAGALEGKNHGDETAFMGKPLDLIESFNRHFMPSTHTHLDEGGAQGAGDLGEKSGGEVREILPWLKISAELDPNRIETYMVTAYWLRKRMGKVDEAEQFLREGLRVNPYNPALLFELGRIYDEDRKDHNHARNLWELAVNKSDPQQVLKSEPDKFILFQLTLSLARMEENQGNLEAAIRWMEQVKTVSPNPPEIEKQIAELRLKLLRTETSHSETPAKAGKQSP